MMSFRPLVVVRRWKFLASLQAGSNRRVFAAQKNARFLSSDTSSKERNNSIAASSPIEETSQTMKFSTTTAATIRDEDELERIQACNESQRSMTKNIISATSAELPSTEAYIKICHSNIIENLTREIEQNAWSNKIEVTPDGERAFFLDSVPMVNLDLYRQNNTSTGDWLWKTIASAGAKNHVLIYIGFEAFYHTSFDSVLNVLLEKEVPIKFSPLVKSSEDYIRNKGRYDAMETNKYDWENRVVIHFGASHAMDRLLFQEDADGRLQNAWTDGRLIILSPELAVVDKLVYRAGMSHILENMLLPGEKSQVSPEEQKQFVKKCDYNLLDKEIDSAKRRVDEAKTMEEVFTELYRLVIKYVERGQLDSPCYFDSGWESFHLYKSVSQALAADDTRVPWTPIGLINSRNAAIGDSLHAFYATAPEAFPLVVCGDTAALLAGGISMINIHTRNRFGLVVIPNNRGMAIEDVISKRSVDGHKYQYEYVKLDGKRDIFTLSQLKEVVRNEVLSSLRDHLWGVSAKRAEALVLNIDVQSLRKENSGKAQTDAVLMGGSFLDRDFGERFSYLEVPRRRLESIVDVLHAELNKKDSNGHNSNGRGNLSVKIQGCSAIEFMEIFSQLSITLREKLKFVPTPTDLLATRTLLPSLLESPKRTVSSPGSDSNFINSNNTFSVFVSNAAFGLDGLNNLISTHLEYGTGTLVHLAYDAADVVTHYSLVGQVHRNFGVRPSSILPSLYRNHQAYEGQIMILNSAHDEVETSSAIRSGLQNPDVKVILVDMGAPNLTASLK